MSGWRSFRTWVSAFVPVGGGAVIFLVLLNLVAFYISAITDGSGEVQVGTNASFAAVLL